MGPRCDRLPDLPRPLRRWRPHPTIRPPPRARQRWRRASSATATSTATRSWSSVVRSARGLLPGLSGGGLRRAAARARLLRRRPRGRHGAARRPRRAGRDRDLPQPDLRGAVEPPLRHQLLRLHRSRSRHAGGLRRPGRQPRRPAASGPARRRVQPRLLGLALVRPRPPLRRVGACESGSSAYRSWFTFRAPSRERALARARPPRRAPGTPTTTAGSGSTRSRRSWSGRP